MPTITTINRYKWPLLIVVVLALFPLHFAFAGIAEFFYTLVQKLFGWFVFLGAMVLNYGINEFVINFGTMFQTSGLGVTVNETWAIIRDLFNLTFIFGLVFIGFKMILRSDDGNSRRWLVSLIIAALLVNFSLFITKFVVDFSNIMAIEIMNLDPTIFPMATDDSTATGVVRPNEVDLSGAMQRLTNVVTVNSGEVSSQIAADSAESDGEILWSMIFGTMILYLVTAFVYFSAGILLIIRGAVLVILMIVSPFLFLGMVIPSFQGFSRNLWSTLFKRAFLAPIYVALLYISMRVASSFFTPGTPTFASSFTPADGAEAISSTTNAFGPYIIIIVLLLGSLAAAKKLGAEGAGMMINAGNKLQRGGRRMLTRGVGGVGARGLARGAEVANRGYNRASARLANTRTSRYLNTTKTGKAIKAAAKTTAFVGTGGIVGGVINTKNTRATLKAAQGASIAGSETLAEQRAREQGAQKEVNEQVRKDERSESTQPADVRRLSQEELGKMNQEQLEQIADHLTDSQLNGMESEGRKSVAEVDALRQLRDRRPIEEFTQSFDVLGQTAEQLEGTMSGLRRSIQGMTHERRAGLGIEQLADPRVAMHLRDSDIDGLREQGFDATQINQIETARRNANSAYARTGLPPTADGDQRNPAEYTNPEIQNQLEQNRQRFMQDTRNASQLDPDLLADAEIAPLLTPRVIEERLKNGRGMTENQLAAIRTNIQNNVPAENQRMWEQWNERSTVAGELGLQFKQNSTTNTSSESVIATDTNVQAAKDYRDSTNQDDLLNRNN